ncbi:MAG: DUF535 family protein [Janthinobacterium lividum]
MVAITRLAQQLAALPGGNVLRTGFRAAQTWLDYQESQALKGLLGSPALHELAQRHPRLGYKYLGECLATDLTRKNRLASVLHHYDYLLAQARPAFFNQVLREQQLWQEERAGQVFSINLAYPFDTDFEGELSVQFRLNTTLLYTITFTLVPGWVVQSPCLSAALVSRVQGTRNFALIKQATKLLHDIAPSALLMQALYGLAQAFDIQAVAGVSNEQQLCSTKVAYHFDYDGFWQQLGAGPAVNGLFNLPLSPVVKPLEAVKANHRSRTVRKRYYKQLLQDSIQRYVREHLLAEPAAAQ